MKNFLLFFKYFPKNRKSFYCYSVLSFFAGILELCGVTLTYPFVMRLLDNKDYNGEFWNSPVFLGVLIVFLFILKNLFMILYTKIQAHVTRSIEREVNISLMQYFLAEDFIKISKIPLAYKQNIFSFIVPNVINNYILRIQNLNVNFFIFILLMLLLVIKFPLATAVTVIFSFVLIFIQNKVFKPKMKSLSDDMNKNSFAFHQRLNDTLINLKSVKVARNEAFFFSCYKDDVSAYFKSNKGQTFLNLVPPYITEPFIIILLFVLLAVIMGQTYSEPQKLIASFAIIVSAVFRMAPTLSRIQVNLNGVYSAIPLLNELLSLCKEYGLNQTKELKKTEYETDFESIELKNVTFGYEKDKPVLKNINLKIHKGEYIGIAGKSGSGKTTLADIIAGLLTANDGEVLVNGKTEFKPLKIGYIPQEYSIISGSIKDNVVYGMSEVDDNKVIQALKDANLYDFIKDNFNGDINTPCFVDSTGFSQGQKQRLALARALYTNPDILILDEATSSLDLQTEDDICKFLISQKGIKTVIIIAHRLSTIKASDRIVFMQGGTITNVAPYNELISINQEFKHFVDLNNLSND